MLNRLKPPKGAVKKAKRVGRGPGSGSGKTAGRGHKGQNSRSGGGVSVWFEGGQTPLKLRSPKRGFKSPFRVVYDVVNLGQLNQFNDGDLITSEELKQSGLISGKKLVKILAKGELEKKLTIKADGFSKAAISKIEDKGGQAEVL